MNGCTSQLTGILAGRPRRNSSYAYSLDTQTTHRYKVRMISVDDYNWQINEYYTFVPNNERDENPNGLLWNWWHNQACLFE